ncbi:TonB-dependent receptor [Sphingobium sp.]|uniref:TonB-dependent receptor n=1 Tax=Sphingobium sp. TaxID=1912891 RepID=UPI0028BDE9FB|nr:TonB-dependent receptor [Sphingobium sp.]
MRHITCVGRRITLAGLLLTGASPVAAAAQAAPVQATSPAAPAGEGAGAASDPHAEIIVTAQRRSERAIDVPIAITAADGPSLLRNGVTNIQSIGTVSPGVSFHSNKDATSSANIQIRGVGTTGTASSFEGAVGVFIDGVYRTRAGQALSTFLDIGSLQVLRGPQGTLFGKNTSAGAILVTSAVPSLANTEGYAEFLYGNYDTVTGRAAVNVPLTDKLALRVSGLYDRRDGYFTTTKGQDIDRVNTRAGRAYLLYEPSDVLTIKLIGDYSKTGGDCCYGTVLRVAPVFQPVLDQLELANGFQTPSRRLGDRQANLNDVGRNTDIEDYGGTLIAEAALGSGTLTSITGVRKFKEDLFTDADYTGADILRVRTLFESRFISQELTYTGELDGSSKTKYAFGVFFSDENLALQRQIYWGEQAQAFFDQLFVFAPPGFSNAASGLATDERFRARANSMAAFTHWTVGLTDKINLIAGIRFSREVKRAAFTNPYFRDSALDPLALFRAQPGRPYDQGSHDNILSGTLGLQYKPNRNAMVYASYNRGAKAGGVTIDVSGAGTIFDAVPLSPVYRPEKVDAFELGTKVNWMGGRANTNAAIFYNHISDLQVGRFLGLNFNVLNSPKAQSYGIEFDHTQRFNSFLSLSLGGQYLPEASYGVSSDLGILSGRRFPTASKFTGNAGLDLTVPVTPDINVTGRIQVEYRGRYYTTTSTNATQDGFALLNANLGLASVGRGFLIEAYGRNLTNKAYVTYDVIRPAQPGSESAYLGSPRTYGIRVRYTF